MDIYSSLDNNSLFKTIELDDPLLKIIENKEPLYFKASPSGFAVVCSKDKTFRLKRKNHSNTVLLGLHNVEQPISNNDHEECSNTQQKDGKHARVVTFASLDSDFECSLTKGTIDLDSLPIYHGGTIPNFIKNLQNDKNHHNVSVQDLKMNSAISDFEFDEMFAFLKGTEIDQIACILSDHLVTYCLDIIILTLQSSKYVQSLNTNGAIKEKLASEASDYDDDEKVYKDIKPIILFGIISDTRSDKINQNMVYTILSKFSIKDDSRNQSQNLKEYSFDAKKIAIWYGIESLKKYAKNKSITIKEFLIKWKQSFPSLYDVPIEFPWLVGHYYRPLGNRDDKIQWMNVSVLSSDINSRFKELFKLQLTWDIDEIEPFIQDLNVKNLKLEKFILKYARKKLDGKRVVVTSR